MAARKHPAGKSGEADRSSGPAFDAANSSADEIVQRSIDRLRHDFEQLNSKRKERVSN